MTHTARTVLPTDLVALVSYDGRVYANEAMTRDRIATNDSPHPIETAFEQWFSFATGRHTSISVQGATLRGLVSARKRASKLAWEIDCLINASEADNSVIMSLLEQVAAAAGRSGALRIFLRLPAASPSLLCASRAGFAVYRHEQVYRLETAGDAPALPAGLRRRARADQFAIFQLYNSVVPHQLRTIEAMTFAQWSAAQESIGKAAQYVLERDGRIRGWLRVARDGDIAQFDLLGEPPLADDLVDAALARTAGCASVCALLPEFQDAERRSLQARGFAPRESYAVLTRATVRPVRLPRAVPAFVHSVLG
ncbi:MAG TPA: hypothetical protein VEZ14_10705 [Dehalococcoidia bacterium]|nr:hypothetical protein [Dehalococcoidia bacterium]